MKIKMIKDFVRDSNEMPQKIMIFHESLWNNENIRKDADKH
jgi:hypothetical protein